MFQIESIIYFKPLPICRLLRFYFGPSTPLTVSWFIHEFWTKWFPIGLTTFGYIKIALKMDEKLSIENKSILAHCPGAVYACWHAPLVSQISGKAWSFVCVLARLGLCFIVSVFKRNFCLFYNNLILPRTCFVWSLPIFRHFDGYWAYPMLESFQMHETALFLLLAPLINVAFFALGDSFNRLVWGGWNIFAVVSLQWTCKW